MDTSEALRYVHEKGIAGDLVECGVEAGAQPAIMARFLQLKNDHSRHIWMYDTFAGLTQPGQFDYTRSDATIYQMNSSQVRQYWETQKVNDNLNGWCLTPLNKVKQNVESSGISTNKLHYIAGDVMQTLAEPANLPEKIAVLRLDTDWYESSRFELVQLYPRLVSGGVLILDDYFHWDGQRRATDEYFKEQNIEINIVKYNQKVGSMIKL